MAFLGMRGTGDWATNQDPQGWRQMILHQWPNGRAPLTAMLSMLSNRQEDHTTINWWTKTLPSQGGAVSNVYTDALLSSAYTSGGSDGDTVYVKLAAALAQQLRIGHQVMLRDDSDGLADTTGKVTNVFLNGASSYFALKLLEDADGSHDLDGVDAFLIVGNINPEGADMPDTVAYDPTQYTNYMQIFRTPLSITRTARKTRLRTGDQYQEAKRECLELHSIEIEKALIWGESSDNIGSNGKPERSFRGLLKAISNHNSSGILNYVTDETYDDTTWLAGGDNWLDASAASIFKYGGLRKMAICGNGAVLGIQKLVKNKGTYELRPVATSYGIDVMEWITPFGTLYLKTHPLFSYETANTNDMIIFSPESLGMVLLDDTFFVSDPQDQKNRNSSRDATEEEFITEMSFEWEHANEMFWLRGVGLANPA